MNIYRYTFIAACPCNGGQIVYLLELQHAGMVRVEHIKTACALHRQGYQEDIAADLYQRFGGCLTLRATHHGVDIETTLGNTPCQVQAMFAAVPRNATLYDPDEVAFPTQRCADGVDALPPELASIAAVGVAAEEAAAPSAPAREPLTDEQIDEIHLANSDAYERGDVEYESHGFARAIEHHHGIK